MARLYLVRHGRAAAGIAENIDPGLDALGRQQSEQAAESLARLSPMPLFASPLLRAKQTAEPLQARWGGDVRIEPRVAEIPFQLTDLTARAAWLQSVMPGRWSELGEFWQLWRTNILHCMLEQTSDTVYFSHFIAINAAVGHACNDDRMVVFRPDNASITVLSNEGGRLAVVELGGEAVTNVN